VEFEKKAVVNFLKIIQGAIVQSHTVEIQPKLDEEAEELLLLAIINVQEKVASSAKDIIVPFLPADIPEGYSFVIPKQGDKKKLLELSERNAKQYIFQKKKLIEKNSFEIKERQKLEKMKNDFHLKDLPVHMECFDNSNIQGSNPVAACVVFLNGKPAKSQYRHYNIKTVVGANDFASMEEVVYRRYKRILEEKKELPNLVVIDGGKGQLSAAVKSLKKLNIYDKMPIIGIAKKLEEIYFPNDSIPIYLDKNSSTLKIVQHIRNEAHRFGISFHRNKRSISFTKSELEEIPGVGQVTIDKLLKKYGSVRVIKSRSEDDLADVIGRKIAKSIIDFLKKD
jgi:excinuclease ABC subunit C